MENELEQNLGVIIPVSHTPTWMLTTGCSCLDASFDGGFPCGMITEIVGENGVGKTQLALQLLLTVQLPVNQGGLQGACLYLHTDMSFPLRRLHQLASQRGLHGEKVFDQFFIESLASIETLEDILPRLEGNIPNSNIRLIIIDSIASLFRGVFDNNSKRLNERMYLFFKISGKLREMAYKFGVAVVVTNQVTVIPNSDVFRIGVWLMTSGRHVQAALGISWANCVNTRLFMSFVEKNVIDRKGKNAETKMSCPIQVVFGPHLASLSLEFEINVAGVNGVA